MRMVGVPKVTAEALAHAVRDAAGTVGEPLHHRRCRRELQACATVADDRAAAAA
jgi:hypothetical protein